MSTKALLITPFGNQRRVPVADAFEVLHHGQALLVSRRPFVVEMTPKTPEYDEEARHMQGVIVEGAHRGTSGATRWEGHERPVGQPKPGKSADRRFSRGKRLRVFPPRRVHALDDAEQEFRQYKRDWKQRRGYLA